MGNNGDDVTSSVRLFHVRAAATLNVLLPIVHSLNGGMTRRSVLAEPRLRRLSKSDTRMSESSQTTIDYNCITDPLYSHKHTRTIII